MENERNYKGLKKLAAELGAVAFGVCGIKREKKNFSLSPDVIKDLDYAISIAVGLSKKILDEIIDRPTRLYFHHYRQANCLLDHMAMRMANFIQSQGFNALPVPASQIVDWERQTAHLSHKRIAQLSGIGWLGRNNLIVHPRFGAQIRLVTVLTDMPLSVNGDIKKDCSSCRRCIGVCPAAAIKESQKDFDHAACFEKLKFFQKQRFADQYICGVCVKACFPKEPT